jgi:hypothetical protein
MTSATRATFERVAAAIRDLSLDAYGDSTSSQRRYIAAAIATALTPTNPNFNRQRFIDVASGVTPAPATGQSRVEPVALTDEQRANFEAVTSGEYGNLALVSSVLDGETVAVIAAVTEQPDGGLIVTPMYVEVTDDLFTRLTNPAAGLNDVAVPA